jgi:hypothetical protein
MQHGRKLESDCEQKWSLGKSFESRDSSMAYGETFENGVLGLGKNTKMGRTRQLYLGIRYPRTDWRTNIEFGHRSLL